MYEIRKADTPGGIKELEHAVMADVIEHQFLEIYDNDGELRARLIDPKKETEHFSVDYIRTYQSGDVRPYHSEKEASELSDSFSISVCPFKKLNGDYVTDVTISIARIENDIR